MRDLWSSCSACEERYFRPPSTKSYKCPDCRKAIWEKGLRERGLDPVKIRLERGRKKREGKKRVSSWIHNGRRIGVTQKLYEQVLREQNGVCAACGNPEIIMSKRKNGVLDLAVDHSHESGEFRGLLCGRCNRGLGYLKDNIETLENLLKYLKSEKRHKADYNTELKEIFRRS